jgi:osmoprotectant transport system permease protein
MSDLFNFFTDNAGLLVDKTLEHVVISAIGLVLALVIALPVGILLGHRHTGSFIAISVSNVLRALPSLALIAICLAFIGLSRANITIALIALAVPPVLTNAYTAVDNVDPDAVEAARGMGMSESQVLRVIELPLSWPLIFAGIRTASVYVIATAPLAALAGGGGLGDIIVNQAAYRGAGVVAAALCVSLLALAADAALGLLQRALTPQGLKLELPAFEPDVRPVV